MKLPSLRAIAVAVAVAAAMVMHPAHAASLKGSRALQGEQDSIVLKSTVLAELASPKWGQIQWVYYPDSPTDLLVLYKASGENDAMHEFMIRTSVSSNKQIEMRPDNLFEVFAELAGIKAEVPAELKAAVDFVINNPGEDVASDVKLPDEPEFIYKGNRNLEHHQRQLPTYYGSPEWFEDFYCSYREVPNSSVCSCRTGASTPGDAGAFFTFSRHGLLQTAYNFFGGSFGHKIEKCIPSNGVCRFQTLMDDSSVRDRELSRIWHFNYGSEIIYRTHVYDAYIDMFHIAVNELKLYFFPGGCTVNGHGCYTCPNVN